MVKDPYQLSCLTMNKTHYLKTVLVGDINVGKTSLAYRFVKEKFKENYTATLAGDGCVVQFNIWDTAGQEKYQSFFSPLYFHGADIAFIVYDVTNSESFARVSHWFDTLQKYCNTAIPVLVANKCDCGSIVEEGIALSFAASKSLQFVHTSAKTGENVED
ncbi:Ras-related protein Rab-5C [Mactra antiquata]